MGVGSLHVLHRLRRNKNSTEYRFTLHGASAYAPRSIGLRSTRRETLPAGLRILPLFLRGNKGTKKQRNAIGNYCCPGNISSSAFRSFSSAFLANRSRRGLTLKSRRDERPQTGALAPGNVATTEKAPRGRQRPKHVVIKHVTYSVALSGLIIVLRPYPGGSSLRSGAGGVHPRLWPFAPSALI